MNHRMQVAPSHHLGDLLLRLVLWLSLLAGGMVLGRAVFFPPEAWGQVRDAAPVLNEFAATQKQIDARPPRLESIAKRLPATRTDQGVGSVL